MYKYVLLSIIILIPYIFLVSCLDTQDIINNTDNKTDAIEHNKPFIVQALYFQPKNAPSYEEMKPKIQDLLFRAHRIFGAQINRNGFEWKSFNILHDDNDEIIVHHVKGDNDKNYYSKSTSRILNALPDEFNFAEPYDKKDNIMVIIVGGVDNVAETASGVGNGFTNGRFGGYAIIAGKRFGSILIGHELGHVFGLLHTTDCKNCLMRHNLYNDKLQHYEARWLDKHYAFNLERHNDFLYPNIDKEYYKISDTDNGSIKIEFKAKSTIGLHQAHLYYIPGGVIAGWQYLNGEEESIISFEVKKDILINKRIYLSVMNINGGIGEYKFGVLLRSGE